VNKAFSSVGSLSISVYELNMIYSKEK